MLQEVPLPSRLARNVRRQDGESVEAVRTRRHGVMCALCGRHQCGWPHLLGTGGEVPCLVVQAWAETRGMLEDDAGDGEEEAAGGAEDTEAGGATEERRSADVAMEEADGAQPEVPLRRRPVDLDDEEAAWGEEEDPEELEEAAAALLEEPGPDEPGDTVEPTRKRGGAERRGRRQGRASRRASGRAPVPVLEEEGVPVVLARWLAVPPPDLRGWSERLHSRSGALMLAALYQYFLWKRFKWAAEETDPVKEFHRLEAAWQFARRGR